MASDPSERPDEKSKDQIDRAAFGEWYRLAGVGFEFIGAVLLLGGGGWWLDRKFGTGPWLLIAGCALGFVVGLWLMVKAGNKSFRG